MSLRNNVIETVCRQLRKLKSNEFDVQLRTEFGTPSENSRELIKLVAQDFNLIRKRTDDTNLFIGRFLGLVLVIELKLETLLVKIEPDVESMMFGKKLDLFRRLLNELGKPEHKFDPEELEMYRGLIAPLREVAAIRNKMAHDLRYTKFGLGEIRALTQLVKKRPCTKISNIHNNLQLNLC